VNDTFYRATQALKKLPDMYGRSSNRPAPKKLTEAQIDRIGELYQQGYTKAAISREMGLAQSTIYNAVRRFIRSGVL